MTLNVKGYSWSDNATFMLMRDYMIILFAFILRPSNPFICNYVALTFVFMDNCSTLYLTYLTIYHFINL